MRVSSSRLNAIGESKNPACPVETVISAIHNTLNHETARLSMRLAGLAQKPCWIKHGREATKSKLHPIAIVCMIL